MIQLPVNTNRWLINIGPSPSIEHYKITVVENDDVFGRLIHFHTRFFSREGHGSSRSLCSCQGS